MGFGLVLGTATALAIHADGRDFNQPALSFRASSTQTQPSVLSLKIVYSLLAISGFGGWYFNQLMKFAASRSSIGCSMTPPSSGLYRNVSLLHFAILL